MNNFGQISIKTLQPNLKRTRELLDLLNESLGSLIFETNEDGKVDRKLSYVDGVLSLKIALLF